MTEFSLNMSSHNLQKSNIGGKVPELFLINRDYEYSEVSENSFKYESRGALTCMLMYYEIY